MTTHGVTIRTRTRYSAIMFLAIAMVTFTAIMLSSTMPPVAYAGDTVKRSQCELAGLSAPKLNDTAASTGVHDMTMTLTFDCANASLGPSTIVYSNAPGSANMITINSLMWLDTDDGAMGDDDTFSKAGTYTLFIKATMPVNALDWDNSDALPVSLNGATINGAEVVHTGGTSVYKLTMYLPFEVKDTSSIGNGNPTDTADSSNDAGNEAIAGKDTAASSPKTGVEGTGSLAIATVLSLMGAAGASWCLMRCRRERQR